jgi:hypothetical protein
VNQKRAATGASDVVALLAALRDRFLELIQAGAFQAAHTPSWVPIMATVQLP